MSYLEGVLYAFFKENLISVYENFIILLNIDCESKIQLYICSSRIKLHYED